MSPDVNKIYKILQMHRIQTPASLIPMQKSVRKADNLVIKKRNKRKGGGGI